MAGTGHNWPGTKDGWGTDVIGAGTDEAGTDLARAVTNVAGARTNELARAGTGESDEKGANEADGTRAGIGTD